MSYDILKSEKVFEGKIFDIERDTITLPDGRKTIRETVIHGGAAGMLPIDEKGNILLVRQYRHSAKAMTLEIPAGTIEKGEDPYDCAFREIEEETGYKSNDISLMFTMYSAIGFCTERLYIYLCKDLVKGNANPDDDEFITTEAYTVSECIELIKKGEICDSKTIAAILAYKSGLAE